MTKEDSKGINVLAGAAVPDVCSRALEESGFSVFRLPAAGFIPHLGGHADLCVFYNRRELIANSLYYRQPEAGAVLEKISEKTSLPLVLSDYPVGGAYPLDAGLCARMAGNLLIYGKKTCDPLIIKGAAAAGMTLCAVRQGYAACSCAVCGDAVITSDKGIAAALEGTGRVCLLISPGNILLPGFDYGFIGGASGYCAGNRTLYLTGSLALHPDGERIAEFCEQQKVCICCLTDGPLYDCGGLIFIS